MFNKETALEICKCRENFTYFCETYLKINHPTDGVQSLKLYDYQKRYAKIIDAKQFVIGKKFRQGGFTTVALAYMFWKTMFSKGWRGIYASTPKTNLYSSHANEIVKMFYDLLPDWLQKLYPVAVRNKREIKFENGSEIIFHALSTNSCRGMYAHFIFIDEAAFIENMDSIYADIVPMGSSVLAISSPNGKRGWFYDTYVAAESHKNEFYVYYNEYSEHPIYRDKHWQANTKKRIGNRGYLQEVMAEFFDEEDLQNNILLLPAKFGDVNIELTDTQESQFMEAKAQIKSKKDKLREQINTWEKESFCIVDSDDKDALEKVMGKEELSQMGKLVGEDEEFDVYQQDVQEREEAQADEWRVDNHPERAQEPVVGWDDVETLEEFLNELYKKQSNGTLEEFLRKLEKRINEGTLKERSLKVKPHNDPPFQIEKMTEDQVRATFKKLHKDWNPKGDSHPSFEKLQPINSFEEYIKLFEYASDGYVEQLKLKKLKSDSYYKRFEDNVNFQCLDPETLVLCGLLEIDEFKSGNKNWGRPDLVVLHKIAEDPELPQNLNLQFLGGRLCVNSVPTRIKEEDVCDMFNGLQALRSPQEACDQVVDTLREKLKALFGKEEENEHTEASCCE
jgi:hypothetical protein